MFGPFDEAVLGFSKISVFLHRVGPFEESSVAGPGLGPLRILVQLEGAESQSSWIVEEDPTATDRPYARPGEFLRSGKDGPDPEHVYLVVADSSSPVVVVSFTAHEGERTVYSVERKLLLDFRAQPPQVLASMECYEFTSGSQGACGAYDYDYGTRTISSCEWKPSASKFLCDRITTVPTDWRTRTMRSHSFLGSAVEPDGTLTGLRPMEVRALLEISRAQAAPTATAGSRFRDVGLVESVMSIPGEASGSGWHLLVAPGRAREFEAHFLVVMERIGKEPQFVELVPRPFPVSEVETGSAEGTPWDAPPLVTARLLRSANDGPILVQAVATEGVARGLIWIGMEERNLEVVADALLLSTTATYYQGCGMSVRPASAVAVHLEEGPFAASLEIEPEHMTDGVGVREDDESIQALGPGCPWNVRVTWDSSKGFVLEEHSLECADHRPRLVDIDDLGNVTGTVVEATTPQ